MGDSETTTHEAESVALREAIATGLRKCRVEDGAPVRLIREGDVYHITHMVAVEVEALLNRPVKGGGAS